ncbi:MAG: hypothetical protein AAFY41_17650, partial [Bacteroidota bacterium]
SAPIAITNYLYDRLDQFKLKEVIRKTIFPSKEVSYIAKVKSKTEGLQEIEISESEINVSDQLATSNN